MEFTPEAPPFGVNFCDTLYFFRHSGEGMIE